MRGGGMEEGGEGGGGGGGGFTGPEGCHEAFTSALIQRARFTSVAAKSTASLSRSCALAAVGTLHPFVIPVYGENTKP